MRYRERLKKSKGIIGNNAMNIRNMIRMAIALFSMPSVALRMKDRIRGALEDNDRLATAVETTWGLDDLFLNEVASSCSTGLLDTVNVSFLVVSINRLHDFLSIAYGGCLFRSSWQILQSGVQVVHALQVHVQNLSYRGCSLRVLCVGWLQPKS